MSAAKPLSREKRPLPGVRAASHPCSGAPAQREAEAEASGMSDLTACHCSVWDEETSTMHRCMTRALDLGCCGGDGPCRCSTPIAAAVARWSAENPGALRGEPA